MIWTWFDLIHVSWPADQRGFNRLHHRFNMVKMVLDTLQKLGPQTLWPSAGLTADHRPTIKDMSQGSVAEGLKNQHWIAISCPAKEFWCVLFSISLFPSFLLFLHCQLSYKSINCSQNKMYSCFILFFSLRSFIF